MDSLNKENLPLLTQDSSPEQAFSVLAGFASLENLREFKEKYQGDHRRVVAEIDLEGLQSYIANDGIFKKTFENQWDYQRDKVVWGERSPYISLSEAAIASGTFVSSSADGCLNYGFDDKSIGFTQMSREEIQKIEEKTFCTALYFQHFFKESGLVPS